MPGLKTKHPAAKRPKDAISINKAQVTFILKSKGPAIDRGKLALNVAPAKAQGPLDVAAQRRWQKRPNRMDFEGVDAPFGTATIGTPTISKTGEPFAPFQHLGIPVPKLLPKPVADATPGPNPVKLHPKVSFVPNGPDGKPLIKPFNIKLPSLLIAF